ncbi:MAG: Fic family protein [Nanoarchaeota archaeon]|nr:Fic family protein [Nanoarchaeota archaeon]
MVYELIKKVNGREYIYLVHNVRLFSGKNKKITKYIGAIENINRNNTNKLIYQYTDFFNEKELEIRLEQINKLKIGYNYYFFKELEELNSRFQLIFVKDKKKEKLFELLFLKYFIHNSNAIEGSKITFNEVVKLVDKKKSSHKNKNEVQEVINSLRAWEFLKEKFIFNETSLKKLYSILTKDLIMENGEKYPNGYKKKANEVGFNEATGLANTTTPPEKVKEEIKNLFSWYRENKKVIHPIELAFEFNMKYLIIHPFLDGNGRTGRLLMNKILIDYNYLPMVVFKSDSNKMNKVMNKYRDGHKIKYHTYMIENLKRTYREIYGRNFNKFEKN